MRLRVDRANRRIPALPELGEPGDPPLEKRSAPRVARVGRARHVSAGRGLEIRLAVHAVAVAALRRPSVREDAVHAVLRDDLAVHGVHEVEVVRPERARDPQLRIRPMAARLAVGVDRDPVGMRRPHLVTHRVRVGPRDHVHLHTPASSDERAERIGARRAMRCDGATGISVG